MDKMHRHTGSGLSCDTCGRHKDNNYHAKGKALKKKMGEKYTGKKGEYTKTKQGNWHKVHPLDRV